MIKFDSETLHVLKVFEAATKAHAKDCIIEKNSVTFLVEPGYAGRAIGKGGTVVRSLETSFKRKIKIVEFDPVLCSFVKNLITPLQAAHIEEEDGVVRIVPKDMQTRGQLIGRAAQNLRALESVVKRYFPIKEIKVEQPHGK